MASIGSVLVAEDEKAFRESTCRLLERDGFDCHGTSDAEEAIECLRSSRFDLLLTDIRMPHNPDLRLVRKAQELDSQMPIILVTAYPSMETAIRSVKMSVAAYLTKPPDFGELLQCVRTSIEYSRNRRVLSSLRSRLESCLLDLDAGLSKRPPRENEAEELVSIAMIRTLAACLSELLVLSTQSGAGWATQNLCELLDCPQRPVHRLAIVRTIDILKITKGTFKSKALADLRKGLESLIEDTGGFCCRE